MDTPSEEALAALYTQLKIDLRQFLNMWAKLRGCSENDTIICECHQVTQEKKDAILQILATIMETE
jgi:hypothetical protein